MSVLPHRASARQVAAFLGLGKATICTMCEEGAFVGAYRVNRRWRIPREAVLAWESAQRRQAQPGPARPNFR